MLPFTIANRKSAAISDDFPAPVLPTIPTYGNHDFHYYPSDFMSLSMKQSMIKEKN